MGVSVEKWILVSRAAAPKLKMPKDYGTVQVESKYPTNA
jgi:hypothetical protein